MTTKLRLTPDQFLPGDVIDFFGQLVVVAAPEPHKRYVAVAVESIDGGYVVQHFSYEPYRVTRPDMPRADLTIGVARQAERDWLEDVQRESADREHERSIRQGTG